MSIATIIVNYNAGEILADSVRSVLENDEHASVTVVDNASTDKSAQSLNQVYGNQQAVEFLYNSENIGFGPAVNSIARHARADYILVLNPDCILDSKALKHLKQALDSDAKAGLAAPAVVDGHGKLQKATRRRFPDPWKSLMASTGLWRLERWFPTLKGIEMNAQPDTSEPRTCEAVSGACMLIRRSAFEQVGYFDEGYAMHCEDLDLMYRLKIAGWHRLYVPLARCEHQQGRSSSSRPVWVHFQKHRGMARFFKKFQADSYSFPVRWLVHAGIWLRFSILLPWVLIKR